MHLVKSKTRRVTGQTGRRSQDGAFAKLIEWLVDVYGGNWSGGNKLVTRRMKVLETLPIGGKKQLMLVSCDGEKYLVATGPETVQTIVRVEARGVATGLGLVAPELGERS